MHIMIHRICGPWSRQMHGMHTALCAAMHTTCQRMCTVHAVPAREEQAHYPSLAPHMGSNRARSTTHPEAE